MIYEQYNSILVSFPLGLGCCCLIKVNAFIFRINTTSRIYNITITIENCAKHMTKIYKIIFDFKY